MTGTPPSRPRSEVSGDRGMLLELVRENALLRGHFVLASGRESSHYVDARRVTLSALGARLVGRVIWGMVDTEGFDAVGGLTLGADPVVTAVSVASAQESKPIDGLLVRKIAKEHGTGQRVEGPLRPGLRAFVVEDTSTTGSSALKAVHVLREEGCIVTRVITLIDRDEGARQAVEAVDCRFDSVFSISEVLGEPGQTQTRSRDITVTRLTLHADGSSINNPGPAGAGFVLYDDKDRLVREGSEYLGRATNNVAEYEALIRGMMAALDEGAAELTVIMDSSLVINQMNGLWRVKDPNLQKLQSKAQEIAKHFARIRFTHVLRNKNAHADRLASAASAKG
jgi:orotate phosphoribosyltransferase